MHHRHAKKRGFVVHKFENNNYPNLVAWPSQPFLNRPHSNNQKTPLPYDVWELTDHPDDLGTKAAHPVQTLDILAFCYSHPILGGLGGWKRCSRDRVLLWVVAGSKRGLSPQCGWVSAIGLGLADGRGSSIRRHSNGVTDYLGGGEVGGMVVD